MRLLLKRSLFLVTCLLVLTQVGRCQVGTWDLVDDFSQGLTHEEFGRSTLGQSVNPDWVWSYGYYPVGGPDRALDKGGLTLYTHHVQGGEAALNTPLNNWKSPNGPDSEGNINYNWDQETGFDMEAWGPGMSWEPGMVAMMTDFPADGLWTTTVFTAPGTGTLEISRPKVPMLVLSSVRPPTRAR